MGAEAALGQVSQGRQPPCGLGMCRRQRNHQYEFEFYSSGTRNRPFSQAVPPGDRTGAAQATRRESGGGSALDDTLGVLLNHVNKAHLEESPGQQVPDLLNPDSYVKMHTIWAGQILTPTTDFLTGNC
ncbi:hypothetical protein ABZ192_30010 [Streptomyces sp. NPDC006235]|uniref:hypothetical protein n=1 Tax=Streptomyces sp. NPDC006235 TaxID=3156736 RepID=UPI0033B61877